MKTTQKQIKKTSTAKVKATKPVSVRSKLKHHTKRILVPHKGNEFRPHLIRLHGIIAVLVIALLAQMTYGFITTGQLSVLSKATNITTYDLLADTNEERETQGLVALNLNDELSNAAFMKAQDMFEHDYWAHVSPEGVEPWRWFGDVGYNYSYAGENLAKNYPTSDATVTAWMESATHRANILNTHYQDVGFAVVNGELDNQNTTLVVAMYGSPVTVSAVQAANTQKTEFAAPTGTEAFNPAGYFGSALGSLSPVTIAILGLLAIVAIVGVAAHHYRNQLPRTWKRSWRLHHGMYTFVGMIVLGVLIIIATGGGQI